MKWWKKIRFQLRRKRKTKVLKIAHRGASGYALENTVEAFIKALELGADKIEFDLRRTKDNKIVIMHDPDVNRTTDGTGLVKDLTLREIKNFRTLNGETVLTLQGALDLLKNKCICKLDIKDEGMEEEIIKTISDNAMEDTVILYSSIPAVVRKLRELSSVVKIGVGGTRWHKRRLEMSIQEMIEEAKSVKADSINPYYSIISKELVKEAHRNGLKVHVWTINDKKEIQGMKRLGVDAITTDYLDRI